MYACMCVCGPRSLTLSLSLFPSLSGSMAVNAPALFVQAYLVCVVTAGLADLRNYRLRRSTVHSHRCSESQTPLPSLTLCLPSSSSWLHSLSRPCHFFITLLQPRLLQVLPLSSDLAPPSNSYVPFSLLRKRQGHGSSAAVE